MGVLRGAPPPTPVGLLSWVYSTPLGQGPISRAVGYLRTWEFNHWKERKRLYLVGYIPREQPRVDGCENLSDLF
jgi:hypothetical protein